MSVFHFSECNSMLYAFTLKNPKKTYTCHFQRSPHISTYLQRSPHICRDRHITPRFCKTKHKCPAWKRKKLTNSHDMGPDFWGMHDSFADISTRLLSDSKWARTSSLEGAGGYASHALLVTLGFATRFGLAMQISL